MIHQGIEATVETNDQKNDIISKGMDDLAWKKAAI